MTFTTDTTALRKRLMNEANGSFILVQRALSELSAEKQTRRLSERDIVQRIKQLRENGITADEAQKIPA